MTILDDLFTVAEENSNAIQGTANDVDQVVVDVAIVQVAGSDLKNPYSPLTPNLLRNVSLIYSPPNAVLRAPATFAGMYGGSGKMIISAPNFHAVPVQPNYQMEWEGVVATLTTIAAPTADGRDFGVFYIYFGPTVIVFTLGNLRLQAP